MMVTGARGGGFVARALLLASVVLALAVPAALGQNYNCPSTQSIPHVQLSENHLPGRFYFNVSKMDETLNPVSLVGRSVATGMRACRLLVPELCSALL